MTDGEYHMVSKAGTFVVMYAPSDDYSTENATVKVTARSVDGDVPARVSVAGPLRAVEGKAARRLRFVDLSG